MWSVPLEWGHLRREEKGEHGPSRFRGFLLYVGGFKCPWPHPEEEELWLLGPLRWREQGGRKALLLKPPGLLPFPALSTPKGLTSCAAPTDHTQLCATIMDEVSEGSEDDWSSQRLRVPSENFLEGAHPEERRHSPQRHRRHLPGRHQLLPNSQNEHELTSTAGLRMKELKRGVSRS